MKKIDIFFGIKDKIDRLLQKNPISACNRTLDVIENSGHSSKVSN